MTTTYYAPRPRPADPRQARTTHRPAHDSDIRQTLGAALPDGYSWAQQRPDLTLVRGDNATEPGPDERRARATLIRAISRWGAA
ncbi:hypothetical protein ABT282_15970 [Streptomyces sp. NPDC000927]|uniref:hypothetical protein n=1 Tax=Streptomyces sp. NPDC000927 TaxID=3154371 RepID=UPI0033260356